MVNLSHSAAGNELADFITTGKDGAGQPGDAADAYAALRPVCGDGGAGRRGPDVLSGSGAGTYS